VLTEAARVQRFGFTDTELEREKSNLLRGYEQAYAEREKSESGDYASEYVNAFLEAEPIPGIATEYELAKQLLPQITTTMLNTFAKEWMADSNRVVVIQAPEKPTVKVPTEQDVRAVFARVNAAPLKAYEDKIAGNSLVSNPPAPGTIASVTRDSATDVTIWKLSNGARVLLKPTEFQADPGHRSGIQSGRQLTRGRQGFRIGAAGDFSGWPEWHW
jgi:zinc protease